MRRLLIQSYPNREIRVTVVRQQVSQRWKDETQGKTDIHAIANSPPHLSFAQNSLRPTESQSQLLPEKNNAPGYGGQTRFQKFSLYGRRQILRAGGALQRTVGKEQCLFLTLTHPGSTEESFRAIAHYSGMAVKLFQGWLSRHIPNKLSIYTWEWQSRGALHLHMVVACEDRDKGEWIRGNLQAEWIRILDRIAEESQVDVWAKNKGFSWSTDKQIVRVDAQWCEKDVAGYLSKYVSKATAANKKLNKRHFCPSRWYGVSRPLLQLTREMTFKVSLDSLRDCEGWEGYEDCLSVLQQWSNKCYEYSHKVGDGKTVVAYVNETEQESIWESIMTQIINPPDSLSNTEQTLRRLARNGSILIKKHKTWFDTFMQFYGKSRCFKLVNLPSYKDISRADLIFLLDALAYSFRYTQRTRYELPGACQLWYSQMANCLKDATSDDLEWIGAFKV
jgi:hypothetical protein